MNSTLLKELENRNTELKRSKEKLEKERENCSRRASEIQFLLIGIKAELDANFQLLEKIKKGQIKELK